MKKGLIIGGIITVLIVGVGFGAYFNIVNNIKKQKALQIIQKAEEKKANDERVAKQAIKDSHIMNERRVYIRMHAMINTKIVSIDERYIGLISINNGTCDEVLQIIKDNNYSDGDILTTYLNSWIKKDFSNAVAEHNYIWEKLGGGDGKAISLK